MPPPSTLGRQPQRRRIGGQVHQPANGRAVDDDNTRWLAALVAAHGWPRISDVGLEAAHAAWLLVSMRTPTPPSSRPFWR